MRIVIASKHELPDEVVEAFTKLADLQRNKPEHAMLKLQHMGTGVMSHLLEHVGDLTHRMAHGALYNYKGEDEVQEKCEKALKYLKSEYGFAKEFFNDCKTNALTLGIPLEEYLDKYSKLLDLYMKAHDSLPVYNKLQLYAKEAAVSLAQDALNVIEHKQFFRFDLTIMYLEYILKTIKNGSYEIEVSKYKLRNNQLIPYR